MLASAFDEWNWPNLFSFIFPLTGISCFGSRLKELHGLSDQVFPPFLFTAWFAFYQIRSALDFQLTSVKLSVPVIMSVWKILYHWFNSLTIREEFNFVLFLEFHFGNLYFSRTVFWLSFQIFWMNLFKKLLNSLF